MRIASLLLLLLMAAFSVACSREEPDASPTLLEVNGRTISLEQFRREFESTLPSGEELSAEQRKGLQRAFLVQVIDRELVLAEAERRGITVAPEEVAAAVEAYRSDYPAGAFEQMLGERGIDLERWRHELRLSLLMEKMVREAAHSGVEVSDEEVADYYQAHREEFDRPEEVRARQLVVATEAEGQEVLGMLRRGEPFAEIARKHSLSPDAEQGGDLGYFARGEMPPEFDETVFNLPVGRLSELVKSEYGFHVFLVEDRREEASLDLETVRDDIRAELREQKEELAYQEWLRNLRASAALEIDSSLL